MDNNLKYIPKDYKQNNPNCSSKLLIEKFGPAYKDLIKEPKLFNSTNEKLCL